MEPASAVLGVGFEGEVQTDHVVNSDSNKLFTYLFKPPSIGLCQKLELQDIHNSGAYYSRYI